MTIVVLEPGEKKKHNKDQLLPVIPYTSGSVMYWKGIKYGRRTALVDVPVPMTGQIYINLLI